MSILIWSHSSFCFIFLLIRHDIFILLIFTIFLNWSIKGIVIFFGCSKNYFWELLFQFLQNLIKSLWRITAQFKIQLIFFLFFIIGRSKSLNLICCSFCLFQRLEISKIPDIFQLLKNLFLLFFSNPLYFLCWVEISHVPSFPPILSLPVISLVSSWVFIKEFGFIWFLILIFDLI